MTQIKSEKQVITNTCEAIYDFLIDFNNFKSFAPPQVQNWQSDCDNCSFSIEGMTQIELTKGTCTKPSQIIYKSIGKSPLSFDLNINLTNFNDNCECQIILSADLNPFLKIMAEKPLTNFVNTLVSKLKELKDIK